MNKGHGLVVKYKTVQRLMATLLLIVNIVLIDLNVTSTQKYVVLLLSALLIVVVELIAGNSKISLAYFRYYLSFVIQYGILLLYSLLLNFFQGKGSYSSSVINGLYWLIPIFVAMVFSWGCGVHAVDYYFDACIVSALIKLLVAMKEHGIIKVLTFWQYAYFEVHELAFTLGFFLLYYTTSAKTDKKKYWLAWILFVLSFKRIGLFAVFTTLILNKLIIKKNKRCDTNVLKIFTILCIFMCYVWLAIVKSGVFQSVTQLLGVATNTRTELYHEMSAFYKFSPFFTGQGLGFVMDYLKQTGGVVAFGYLQPVGDLHNDILKLYIELGFVMFSVFLLCMIYYQTMRLKKQFGDDAMHCYFIMLVYIIIIALTDNILRYSFCILAQLMIPLDIYLKHKKSYAC